MIRRRAVVVIMAAVIAAPFCAFAQQVKAAAVVGVLRYTDQASSQPFVTAFKEGLKALGYIEGRNLTLHVRFADGNAERLTKLAEDLVNEKVDVLFAMDTPSTRAAQHATKVIPIVIGTATDPVANGLVTSLKRPGGNTTGLSNMSNDISPKRLEMLIALVPKLSRVAVLVNRSNPATRAELQALDAANKRVGLKLLVHEVETPEQIERAFDAMGVQGAQALVVSADGFHPAARADHSTHT